MSIDNNTNNRDEGEMDMATIVNSDLKGSIFVTLKKERANDPNRMQKVLERVEKISPFIIRKDK